MLIWVVIVVLLFVLVMTFVGRRAVGGVDPTQLLFEPDLINRVRALAQAGQKIAAIKLLRGGTPGLGLASAKVMVDKMAASRGPGLTATDLDQPDPGSGADLMTGADMMPSAVDVPLEVELQARSFKSAGQPIRAIKLVREHTSWGLREAKDYVDAL